MPKRSELPVAPVVDETPADVQQIDSALADAPPPPDDDDAPPPDDTPPPDDAPPPPPPPDERPAPRRPGRPAGRVTGASYRGIKSKQALRDILKERDRQLKELQDTVAGYQTAAVSVAATMPLDESFATMLDVIFDTLAMAKRAPHWKLPPGTRDKIARPLAVAAAPHMGEITRNMPLVVAASALGSHVIYAMQEDRKVAARDVGAE